MSVSAVAQNVWEERPVHEHEIWNRLLPEGHRKVIDGAGSRGGWITVYRSPVAGVTLRQICEVAHYLQPTGWRVDTLRQVLGMDREQIETYLAMATLGG
jgi:hypothetical protein